MEKNRDKILSVVGLVASAGLIPLMAYAVSPIINENKIYTHPVFWVAVLGGLFGITGMLFFGCQVICALQRKGN